MFRRTAAAVALLAVSGVVPAWAEQTAVPVHGSPVQRLPIRASPVQASLVQASLVQASPSGPQNRAQAARPWPRTVSGHTGSRYPEGVAWDPTRKAFLIGSMAAGTVSVVDRAGRVRTLVSDPKVVSTFGLRADPVRGRLLVAYADIGLGERSSPETTYVQSGVGIYDLRTGGLLHRVNLNTAALNPQGGRHGANDLAIDRAGNAYVTDPASDAIYRVTVDGKASVLLRDARFRSDTIGLNGIVWHPAGFLLAVRYDTGKLLRVSLRGSPQIHEVDAPPLVGGDGLVLTRHGKLVAVTNKLGADGIEAVTVLRSRNHYRSANAVSTQPWPIPAPTTVALSPYGAYVLSGRIDIALTGGNSNEFSLRRIS